MGKSHIVVLVMESWERGVEVPNHAHSLANGIYALHTCLYIMSTSGLGGASYQGIHDKLLQ